MLSLLLSGETVSSAAGLAGVGERSVYRWLAEPGFRETLKSSQAQVLASVERSLVALSEQAVAALASTCSKLHKSQAANIKRLAAVSVLELVLNFRETLSFEERLNALEMAVKNEQKNN